jgi:hypothetical protein
MGHMRMISPDDVPVVVPTGGGLGAEIRGVDLRRLSAAAMIGDTVGGLLSDWLYRRTGGLQAARRNVIVAGMRLFGRCRWISPRITPDRRAA